MKFNLDKIKENNLILQRKSLVGKTKGLPSLEKRHIKNVKKVEEAFDDLYKNHNHSWFDEVYLRNKYNLDRTALFYRGKKISYATMFNEASKLISALSNFGLRKGDEVPMCVSNTPELVYLLLACSALGLKPNIFGADFEQEYIKEIVNTSNNKIMFISDDNFIKNPKLFTDLNVSNKIYYSVYDNYSTRAHNNYANAYIWNNETEMMVADDYLHNTCTHFNDFVKKYDNGLAMTPDVSLDDDFTITYTSGSTKNGRPKALVHRVRSFNVMGRFHDTDLSGNASMHNLCSLAHIPPHSNTCLITSISDMLFQGGSVALEPIYSKETFLDSLILNKPSLVPATRSFWIYGMKEFLKNPKYKDLKFPNMLAPIAVGEAVSANEEKFINDCFRKLKMGTKVVPFPITPSTLSIGGGDCEHGGLFFILFKNLRERLSLSKEEYGLKPFALADVKVLDENLNECHFNELGTLVGNSLCTMREYKGNPLATENFFIKDNSGDINGNFKVWAYIDKKGNVHMKGRMDNDFITESQKRVPLFMIAETILEDKKNIMSCEVVNIDGQLVAHIELYPNLNNLTDNLIGNILEDCKKRINEKYDSEISLSLNYVVRDSYPLTGCGKRNLNVLEQESTQMLSSLTNNNRKLIKKL